MSSGTRKQGKAKKTSSPNTTGIINRPDNNNSPSSPSPNSPDTMSNPAAA
jgi:hypothetical protein